MPKTTFHGLDPERFSRVRKKVSSIRELNEPEVFSVHSITQITAQPKMPVDVPGSVIDQLVSARKAPIIKPVADVRPGTTGAGAIIAILDTGISDHNALKGKVIKRINTDGVDAPVEDTHGHGTHLAGIIAADDLDGKAPMQGLATGARLVSVKVTTDDLGDAPIWRITRGLQAVLKYNDAQEPGKKITAVLICYNASDNVQIPAKVEHHSLAKHIQELVAQHIPVICSAGNLYAAHGHQEGLAYPAYVPHVIACGSLMNMPGEDKGYAPTSQRIDPATSALPVYYAVAPGYRTLSTGNDDPTAYSWLSGSSQAAAVVAATIALLQQEHMERHAGALPAVKELADKLYKTP